MLQSLEKVDPQEAGGKGAALARLLRHGFPVPATWVLPYGAFAAFWAHNRLDRYLRAEDWAGLEQAILGGSLPFSLVAPGPLLAVRSSAGDEDGKEGSAAGQYHSILSVKPEDLADAVRRCWASYYGPEARAYRKKAPEKLQMALLVQEMVDARSAGVLFTINPLNGSWREMPIEAVWGLGESLVSGRMVPDRYLLRRPRRTPPALIAGHMELRLEEETIAPQTMQLLARSGRVEEQEAEAPKARKLGQVDLVKLGRLGLRAEALFGEPQDVEWAQDRAGEFWVLQSRPITTHARLPRGGSTLWTRRFLGERWPQGASPLGWSLMEPILEWFIAYPQTSAQFLGGDPPLRLVRGHPYLNATVFRHLAFKLPGRPPPQFMLEFFPPDEADHWLRRWGAPPDFRVYASILKSTFEERRWERFRWNPFRNHRAWNSFREQLGGRLAELAACPPEDAVRVGSALVRDYIKIHITSLLFANLYYQLVAPLLQPEDQELLLRPPAGTITSKVNRELWRLSKDPELLPSFLKEHGHRSVASWEIFSPRWIEDPEAVLQLSLLWRDRPDPALTRQEEDRKTQLALDKIDQPLLKQAVVLAQAYLGLREEQRYHFDRILLLLKQKLCALGAGLPDP
ncbi:MAG TPA: PEP/pyruvate-binding domain-containing protein, partial [Myxococcota bacterium]|nr:PEP/pyruvate-binding domain-containing protein [Myxococcota bacterium]